MCKKKEEPVLPDPVQGVMAALAALYKVKILPLEQHFDYELFDGPYLYDAEFHGKPCVLLIGQYSTGKTTLIRYLVGEDIPGSRIGPEPTTDTFTFVMYDQNARVIPGTSLMAESNFPFRGLSNFGATFLGKCNAATVNSRLLQSITFIDTPGILSGEKQRLSRGYDFEQVVSYLAEKVDRILLLFDAHKLDISDELKRAILALTGNEEKVRIVLNKVDSLEPNSLQRVNGALMWSLGKVLKCPEVPKVYSGSFWDKPIRHPQYRELFEHDTKMLFEDLRSLPRTVNIRRINDVVKRAKQVKIFAFIMDEVYRSSGIFTKREKVIAQLDTVIYAKVILYHRVPPSDMPNAEELKKRFTLSDPKKWQKLDKKTKKLLGSVDDFMNTDVTRLLQALPADSRVSLTEHGPLGAGGKLHQADHEVELTWAAVVAQAEDKGWRQKFDSLEVKDGKLHTTAAKAYLLKSGLPEAVLGDIWKLCDTDNDNKVDLHEFYLMNFFIDRKLAGKDVPRAMPTALLPPPVGAEKSLKQASYTSTKGGGASASGLH